MSESYAVSQGSGLTIDAIIRDSTGTVITTYSGTETLACVLWPGGNRVITFSPAAEWTDAATGTIAITIDDADTTALPPGRYDLLLRIDDDGQMVDAYKCNIVVTRSAGADVATKVYTTLEDLETYGGSWLSQVQREESEAGFWEEQERARTKLEAIAHAHNRIGGGVAYLNGSLGGPRISGGRSQWLQDQFDADRLIVTGQVKEACALYALSLICSSEIGTGDTTASYGRLARMYQSKFEYLISCMTLGIDTDGDGQAEYYVDLTSVNSLYA